MHTKTPAITRRARALCHQPGRRRMDGAREERDLRYETRRRCRVPTCARNRIDRARVGELRMRREAVSRIRTRAKLKNGPPKMDPGHPWGTGSPQKRAQEPEDLQKASKMEPKLSPGPSKSSLWATISLPKCSQNGSRPPMGHMEPTEACPRAPEALNDSPYGARSQCLPTKGSWPVQNPYKSINKNH